MSQRREWLASLIARTAYNRPFDGFPTLSDSCTLDDVLECGNVQIVYFGLMRDAHHANDRLIVQAELDALKMPDLVVLCVWDHQDTIKVFGLRRFLTLKKAKSYVVYRRTTEEYEKLREQPHLSVHSLFEKQLYPRMLDFECIAEEREDFDERIRQLVAFGGVVVGHIYYDTAECPREGDREAIVAYIASKLNADDEFALFTRFEDHGCHGSVYHFIVRKVADVQQ